ncbi:MAG: L-threonylcarbamoyladenylate synthase [Clostridium sp.]|nr:L-threonylcarbamoyladenylate synthase [Clostridium sp.]
MQHLQVYPTSIDERAIAAGAKALADGKIVVYPTDSLYALGCDALSSRAIERLCAAKGINPAKQMLSIVCSDISMAAEYAQIDNRAFSLLKRHLPGPFTFVLPASSRLPKAFKGRRTVGIRIPSDPVARALVEALGRPMLSASATEEGEELTVEEIAERHAAYAELIIDGGEPGTQATTIVDCLDSRAPEVARQGKGIFEG